MLGQKCSLINERFQVSPTCKFCAKTPMGEGGSSQCRQWGPLQSCQSSTRGPRGAGALNGGLFFRKRDGQSPGGRLGFNKPSGITGKVKAMGMSSQRLRRSHSPSLLYFFLVGWEAEWGSSYDMGFGIHGLVKECCSLGPWAMTSVKFPHLSHGDNRHVPWRITGRQESLS